jgi:hypothetical protein
VIGVVVVAATVGSYVIGWLIGSPILVPILNAAASYPFMVAALRRGDVRLALGRMLLWALAMGVCATIMSYHRPAATDRLFIRGEAYRVEMHAWVMTGRGAESTPSQFIPQQIGHAVLFSALAILTGGALAMPMGAVLMNYMGHYVGTLAAIGAHPLALMILGWHPWAVIRIISFVVIGVVLSVPLVVRPAHHERFSFARPELVEGRRLLAWAGAGLVVDVVLKTLLAPTWQRVLVRLL